MTNTIALDQNYSTTRLLMTQKPEIVNKPEDKFETILFLPSGEGRQGEGGLRTRGYFKQSYEEKPLISIITVVFNGEKYLEETIQSVINQTYDNVEYIIIDGGSTDGTLEIIKRYEDNIDYWSSEPDRGIYDAMNKGLIVASGEFVNFLNGGDKFYRPDLLEDIFSNRTVGCSDLVYGDFFVVSSEGKPVRAIKATLLSKQSIKKGMVVNHQSVFVRKAKCPYYDLSYKYKAEWKWLIDILYTQEDVKTAYIAGPVVYYRLGGFSAQGFNDNFKEYISLTKQKFGLLEVLKNSLYMCRVFFGFHLRRLLKVDSLRFYKR